MTCKVYAGVPATPGAPANGQSRAFTDGDHEAEAVFYSKGFGVRKNNFTGTISTTISSIDPATISQFAKRDGRIEVSAIVDSDPADEEEDEKPARKPRKRKTAEPTPADEEA